MSETTCDGHVHASRKAAAVCRIRQRKMELIRSFKEARGCAVCGERDWVVLDLDHRDPSTKHPRLKAGHGGAKDFAHLSFEALAAELEKCDVLCSNDHRRKTRERREYRPDLVGDITG